MLFRSILARNNFWQKANDGIEKSFALGLGALVVNINGVEIGETTGTVKKGTGATIAIDFINETKLYPITVENREVKECAFFSQKEDGYQVVVHMRDESGTYIIHNYELDKNHKIVETYDFNTKSKIPWFFVMRPNVSSNFITELVDDEVGISVYANCLDVFRAIDNKYDGFDLEYVLGRKRMFISTEAWTVNKEDGTSVRTFDPYDQLFYHLPENDKGEPLITQKSDDLRFDAYIKGINAELSFLSMKCGLGEGFFKFDGNSIATATQVISENSTLFRNIKKHEILLEDVLFNLTKVVMAASNEFTDVKFSDVKDEDITIIFDDSIIEDKEAEMLRDRADVTAGIMSVIEYRMKWMGEDEDTATQKYQTQFQYQIINNYLQALTTGAMTVEQYVDKVFPDSADRQGIIDYITEFVGTRDDFDPYEGDETGEEEETEETEEEDEDKEDDE